MRGVAATSRLRSNDLAHRGHEHLVHPALVHVDHLEAQAAPLEVLTRPGNVTDAQVRSAGDTQ